LGITAAVVEELHGPFVVQEVTLAEPGQGEVDGLRNLAVPEDTAVAGQQAPGSDMGASRTPERSA